VYSTTGLTILIYTVTRFVCVNPDRFDWFNIYNRLPAFSNIFHVFILTWLGQLGDDKKTHVFVVSIFYTLMCSSTEARSAAFSVFLLMIRFYQVLLLQVMMMFYGMSTSFCASLSNSVPPYLIVFLLPPVEMSIHNHISCSHLYRRQNISQSCLVFH